jgi:hypothetical protein
MLAANQAMNTNNPRYWFRAKRYGLGWGLPLEWQGWAIFVSWILIFPLGIRFLTPGNRSMRWGFIVAMVIFLLVICYWKGEPTGRRWNRGDGN